MIKGLTCGRGIVISGGGPSAPYINMSSASAGLVRYNGTDLQVYDGSTWMTITSSYANIELDPDVHSLLEWARKKRKEEYELEILAESNPTIKDLVEQIKQKEEQIKMVQTIMNSSGGDEGMMLAQEPMRP